MWLGWVVRAQDLTWGFSQRSAALQWSDGLAGSEGFTPHVTPSRGWPVSAHHMRLSVGLLECLRDMATSFLQNKKFKKPRQKPQYPTELASGMTHSMLECSTSHTGQLWSKVGGDYTRVWRAGSEDLGGWPLLSSSAPVLVMNYPRNKRNMVVGWGLEGGLTLALNTREWALSTFPGPIDGPKGSLNLESVKGSYRPGEHADKVFPLLSKLGTTLKLVTNALVIPVTWLGQQFQTATIALSNILYVTASWSLHVLLSLTFEMGLTT